MTIVARMLTQEAGRYSRVHGASRRRRAAARRPDGAPRARRHRGLQDRRVPARQPRLQRPRRPACSTCSGSPGTHHIGAGADLQAKHADGEFLEKMDEAWRYLTGRHAVQTRRARRAIGHCMGGRLLIPFAADHPELRAIVLYYPVRPRRARDAAPAPARVQAGEDAHVRLAGVLRRQGLHRDAAPSRARSGRASSANGRLVEWHFFSDANHGFRHPDNAGFQPHYADLAWPLVTDFLQRTELSPSTRSSSAPASPGCTCSTACAGSGSRRGSSRPASGVGGTWYWNRYPGARCDVESMRLLLLVLRGARAGVGVDRALRRPAGDPALPRTTSPTASTCAATSSSTRG